MTSPRCSERRTLPPLTACKAKSGAARPSSGYAGSAAACAPQANPTNQSQSSGTRRIARLGRCEIKRCPSATDAAAASESGRARVNPRTANFALSTNGPAVSERGTPRRAVSRTSRCQSLDSRQDAALSRNADACRGRPAGAAGRPPCSGDLRERDVGVAGLRASQSLHWEDGAEVALEAVQCHVVEHHRLHQQVHGVRSGARGGIHGAIGVHEADLLTGRAVAQRRAPGRVVDQEERGRGLLIVALPAELATTGSAAV